MGGAVARRIGANYGQQTAILRYWPEEMVAGRLTVDEAAAELDRRADAILEKRRWMLDEAADAASLAAAAALEEAP